MRLFRDSTRCHESATSIAGPCGNVTGRVKSRTCLVRTKTEGQRKSTICNMIMLLLMSLDYEYDPHLNSSVTNKRLSE